MTSSSSASEIDVKTATGRSMHGSGASGSVLRALWTLVVLTLRQHLHGKRWMIMAFLFLLPAGLAMLVRATEKHALGVEVEFVFAFMFIPQALLPLVALVYASGMIQDEQEEQTITYLLVRPIPKPAMYGAKLLATLITTVVLTIVFTCLTYVAIYIGAESKPEDVILRSLRAASIHALAVIAYCCLFGLMSLFTKRTLIAGIIYAAVFEGLLANLPFGIRLITVIYYARLIAYRTMKFILPTPGRAQNIAAEAWNLDIRLDPRLLEHPQQATCFAVLLLGSLILALLAAFLCSRREFHVKTPQAS
ncbi:MAG: ABC transporter permease [Tepidisphaerales bacterium]